MAHHVQQLQQTGFDDGQVRALASFVGDVVRGTMRPFIERADQRFDAVDQRFEAMDQRFEVMGQRFGDMQKYMAQNFDVVNHRFSDMLSQMGQHFNQMNQRVDRVETRRDNLE